MNIGFLMEIIDSFHEETCILLWTLIRICFLFSVLYQVVKGIPNKIKKENVPLSCNFGTWQTLSEVRITVTCNLR